ncbi:MAG: class I SAM-dependent methyltransferase [Candidatus Melainabacteria bacterium]|nr:class I SAM-dependent methyltransferase [Candidatus Melainabacteria bacterium]
MSCLLCNSKHSELRFQAIGDLEYNTYTPVNYFSCRDCGFLWQEPIPDSKVISSFYPSEYRNYLPVKDSLFATVKKMQFKSLANKLTKNLSKDSLILEIGFGNGELLRGLKRLGYKNLYGLDFVEGKNSDLLISENIKVKYTNAESGIPFEKSFDLIMMNNVIEHFTSPFKVLKNCKEKLTKGGKVILLTPNSNAFEFMIFGKYWAGFHAPRHTYIFNNKNIKLAASQLGYSDVR